MNMSADLQLLQLMRLVSPALPVGAFAYSQGLEGAIEQQWVTNQEESYAWISGVLKQNIAALDLPGLFWQMQALQQEQAEEFCELNHILYAYRETYELRLETQQMGMALLRLLRDTQDTLTPICRDLLDRDFHTIDWVSAFALAAAGMNLDPRQALLGYGWAWAETQVAAAIKLVPLGQTQGQKMLIELNQELADLIEKLFSDMPEKSDLGAISPNLAIVSSLHETQYSRLFRS